MKILLTGASGFVGSHLLEELKGSYETLNLTRSKKYCPGSLYVDYSSIKSIQDVLNSFQPEIIIHLASDRERKKLSELSSAEFNQFLTNEVNIAECVRGCKSMKLFINFGTSDSNFLRNTEKGNGNLNAYGFKKLISSEIFKLYCKNLNIPYVNIIPSVIYGPGQRNDMLIPYLIENLSNKKLCTVNNPYMKKNFIYIDDVSEAIKKILNVKNFLDLPVEYFLEYKKNYRVQEVAELVAKKINANQSLIELNKKSKDFSEHYINKQSDLIGLSPKTSLSEGIEKLLGNKKVFDFSD